MTGKGKNADYAHLILDPSEARRVRRCILHERRNRLHDEGTHLVGCGHFDEKYIAALKGMHGTFIFATFI
jgi:hypothetical protein